MTFSGVKQIALIFLTMVAPLAAASDSSFLGVKAWQGSVSLSSSDSGQVTSMFGQEVWSTSYQADLKITLDQFDADGQLWQGPVTGSVHIQHKMVQTMPDGCVVTTTATADGPPDTFKIKSSVLQVANGQYWFGSLPTNVKGRRKSQMVCPDSGTVLYDDISGEQWWPVTDPTVQSWFALPESGLSLQGAADVKLGFPLTVYGYSMNGAQNPKLSARLTWQFQPLSVSQDEVTVSIPGYDTWRPQAGTDGGRGNSITLNAELRKTEGGAPAAKAVRFEWSFPNISHELGYAINAPIVSADQKPDMRFEPSATLTIDDELGQKAHTPDGIYTTSMAQISSYDWGGYGTVQVIAVLEDGRRITGHLEGSTSQTEILLPKRAAGDTIAEAWRKQMGIGTLGDTTDDDNFPVGDGNKGDGLTLYEEYRGWMENGKHKEGDPTKKDFFVVNTAGSGYTPGILLYGSKSQLSIHYELLRSELSGDRVINFNHTQAPHRIDQHGVVIVSVSDGSSPEAHSDTDHPDTPAHIKSITVPKMTGSTTAVQQQSLAATLAHELAHSNNVYHHGDDAIWFVLWTPKQDEQDVWLEQQEVNGALTGTGEEVRIKNEDGSPYRPVLTKGYKHVWLAGKGSPGSGNDNCFMRYDNMNAYVSSNLPHTRYRADEQVGFEMCSSPVGTGVNKADRLPESRYGDAAPYRGDCVHQILVNDAVSARIR